MPDTPDRPGSDGDRSEEVYLELQTVGSALNVAAIAASDGLEVRFQVPAQTPREDIKALAFQKLAYVRKKSGNENGPPKRRPGIYI